MIRLSPRNQRLASLALGALVVGGCATRRVAVETVAPPPRPDVATRPDVAPRPDVATRPGRPGFVVAAAPGARDVAADVMATEIARRTGFGLVAAGAAPIGQDAYARRVQEAAQGPLRFYAEIHGSERGECAGRIEIATVGVDRELALRWRALAELIRDAHLRANRDVQRLDVTIAPAEARDAVLSLPQRALQIDVPRCSRRDWRETYTSILADFLAQAVGVPVGR